MKKLLLVVFIGLVLAINLYGFVTELIHDEISYEDEVTVMMYTE